MADFAFQFWTRVDKRLKEKGASVRELSDAIGVSYDVVRQWRSKNRYPKGQLPMEIASWLGVSVEYLLSGKGPASSNTPDGLSDEAWFVQEHPETWPIVRIMMKDPSLVPHLSAVFEAVSKPVMSEERNA